MFAINISLLGFFFDFFIFLIVNISQLIENILNSENSHLLSKRYFVYPLNDKQLPIMTDNSYGGFLNDSRRPGMTVLLCK